MKKDNTYILIGFLIVILFIIHQNDKEININILKDNKEDTYLDDQEPKRYYDSRYHSRNKMRINVPTRGEPPSYQQVGILTDIVNPENIKPLYGRQTYNGSGHWNYYTSLDSHLATKIPIELDNNDCTDERGCNEIYKKKPIN